MSLIINDGGEGCSLLPLTTNDGRWESFLLPLTIDDGGDGTGSCH